MPPSIHLVTYATPRFRPRQLLLGASARVNRVADTVTSWTPKKLLEAGFEERCKDIKLTERGSGFWAWKPFIIQQRLEQVPENDIVFYCDVGRRFPYKQLTYPINGYLDWMTLNGQDMMPGIYIPWKGSMSQWTKRDAFVATGMDQEEIHRATPLQASFSIWRNTQASRLLVAEWLDNVAIRSLVSDDPSIGGLPELIDYHDHRHDQSLLTLACIKHGIKGISIGAVMPPCDTQHPSEIAEMVFGNASIKPSIASRLLGWVGVFLAMIERHMRKRISFGTSLGHDPGPFPSQPS